MCVSVSHSLLTGSKGRESYLVFHCLHFSLNKKCCGDHRNLIRKHVGWVLTLSWLLCEPMFVFWFYYLNIWAQIIDSSLKIPKWPHWQMYDENWLASHNTNVLSVCPQQIIIFCNCVCPLLEDPKQIRLGETISEGYCLSSTDKNWRRYWTLTKPKRGCQRPNYSM